MAERKLEIGQRFRKTDSAGMVFEVVEFVQYGNLPHVLIAPIDDPEDRRLFAVAALFDKRGFVAVSGRKLPRPSSAGRLKFSGKGGKG